jgi:hypothetical protein
MTVCPIKRQEAENLGIPRLLQSSLAKAHDALWQSRPLDRLERKHSSGGTGYLPREAVMAHLADKIHFVDKQTLARVNSAIMLVLIGSGLAACALGALIYDLGRLFSAW